MNTNKPQEYLLKLYEKERASHPALRSAGNKIPFFLKPLDDYRSLCNPSLLAITLPGYFTYFSGLPARNTG
ncbi:hypothetical protein BCL69_10442 [Nitrosomonas communis]|uniref:Uncharacterized protein n=1 Tax=Nitrosomonas communis TaxID=44574 RepID=A0A5D3YE41_9PROT|nr:hypothetical protein BCL69_10442 [Nitrosomonas communis]